MKKRIIYITIGIAFSLYLGACASSVENDKVLLEETRVQADEEIQDGTENSKEQENIEQKSASQEDIEPDDTETENVQWEERLSELTLILNEKLSVGDNREEKAVFVDWLLHTYGLEQLELIDFAEDIDRQL